jgi:hypothetical protein
MIEKSEVRDQTAAACRPVTGNRAMPRVGQLSGEVLACAIARFSA